MDSPDLRRSPSLHEAPQWPQELPSFLIPAHMPLDFPPALLPIYSFPSHGWSQERSGERKEAGVSKKGDIETELETDACGVRCAPLSQSPYPFPQQK